MAAILIVEDDVLANEHLEFILQQAGYEVLSATSADEAAELLEDHEDVRLIVTDINLPGTMNGLKLAAAAKARRPEMNIIIVTGYSAHPAREPIRSKTVQCPKDDRGSTAFPIAAPAEVDRSYLRVVGRWSQQHPVHHDGKIGPHLPTKS